VYSPLLTTKLAVPQLRSRLVERFHLIDRLNTGSECGFLLVCAPAGYGKTTLLSIWLSQAAFDHTWLTLDESDNDLVRFLTYMAAALEKINPTLGSYLEASLQTSTLPTVEGLLTPLINLLSKIEQPFWLVLDDYHVIHNQTIHQMVAFLLAYRPAPFHLAIATRADPPFPLSRMRARSQLIELRMADLRFSSQEVINFFAQVLDVPISEDDLTLLETSTEGWIAGLQMAGLSMQGRENISNYIQSFSGEDRFILDYLFDEVFQHQSLEIQEFLLQTSILRRLCGALCNEVSLREDSQEILERLERNNLFVIALDNQRKWFRYHHLFSDLLKNRLEKTYPELNHKLHQRASAWYNKMNYMDSAIEHALTAQDFDNAAIMIEKISSTIDLQIQQPLLISWLDQVPQHILETHPWLCVHQAWGNYWSGRRGLEEQWLHCAERSIPNIYPAESPEFQRIQGHIAVVRAHTAIINENIPETLKMAEKALNLLPDGDKKRSEAAIALAAVHWARGEVQKTEQCFKMAVDSALESNYPSMAVGCTGYLAIQQIKGGRMQEAIKACQDGLRIATLQEGLEMPIAGFLNVRLGDIWRERDDLDLAWRYLEQGVQQCQLFGQVDILVDAYICMGRYQLAVGDLAGALTSLRKCESILEKTKVDPFVSCWFDEFRINTWLAEYNWNALQHWKDTCGLELDDPLSYQYDLHHQNLAKVLIAQGIQHKSTRHHEQALTLLTRLHQAAFQAGWVHEEIKISVMQAVNYHMLHNPEAALLSLGRAVMLAEPNAYLRIFLDEGSLMQRLLEKLDAHLISNTNNLQHRLGISSREKDLMMLSTYISRLISAFSKSTGLSRITSHLTTQPAQGALALFEALSPREMEVLGLLAQGLADKQIAEKLFITRETVHKHLKNIYSKLDVHNRTSAVARARELGLI
jgi:LuxR family transcriptional regulator, maltose regulon positive regulatory protein